MTKQEIIADARKQIKVLDERAKLARSEERLLDNEIDIKTINVMNNLVKLLDKLTQNK